MVPLDRSKVPGNSVSEEHDSQHQLKIVPLDKSNVPGNSVSEVHPYQLTEKAVAPLKSNASNLGATRSVLPRQ